MLTELEAPRNLSADVVSMRLRDYLTDHPHASDDQVVAAMARTGVRVNARMVRYVKQFLPAKDTEATATYYLDCTDPGTRP